MFSRPIQCFVTFSLLLQTLLLVELVFKVQRPEGRKASLTNENLNIVILQNNVTVLEMLGIPFLIISHGAILHRLVAKFPARDQVSRKGDSLRTNSNQGGLGKASVFHTNVIFISQLF